MDVEMEGRARVVPLEVQTLLRQPDQAAQTTVLTIYRQYQNDILDMSIFNDDDWTIVEAALVQVTNSDEERAEWLSAIRKGFWDALIALELTLLPNLESIALPDVCMYMDEHKWYKTVLEKVAERQRGTDKSTFLLPKLRNVSLAHWDTEGGMAMEELVVFMSVPSVQQLDAFMVSDGWEASPGMSFSLKDLCLALSCIDSTALRDLIRCCPQLEKFSYQAGGAIIGDSMLIPSVLSPALATLKSCLQELEIIDDDEDGMRDDWSDEDGDPDAPMASFADFEKLHTLSLRACMLVGKDEDENNVESEFMELDLEDTDPKISNLVDVVPKSLKNLSLSHCGSGVLPQLEQLLARKEELTPVLERIQIANKENCAIDEVEAQRLADGFKERNVHLNIVMCCATGCHGCAKPKEIHAQTQQEALL